MLNLFQALMPKNDRFFDLFNAHAAVLVKGADALVALLEGGTGIAAAAQAIVDHEHAADDITREVLLEVRRSFITPFDRSAITDLIGVMDDAIDQMNKTAKTITLYRVAHFQPEMQRMGAIIAAAARLTAEGLPLLKSLASNADRLNRITGEIVRIEGEADDIHDAGLSALYQATGNERPMDFIIGRELYSSLERVVDRFEDVANEIQGLVIDHA